MIIDIKYIPYGNRAQFSIIIVGSICNKRLLKAFNDINFSVLPFIPVEDVDGDDVRCRWAESSKGECGGVCRAINATLFGVKIIFLGSMSKHHINVVDKK